MAKSKKWPGKQSKLKTFGGKLRPWAQAAKVGPPKKGPGMKKGGSGKKYKRS